MGYVAILLATIIDFPSLITIAACSKVRSWLKVILWAVIAATCGELVGALVRPTYELSFVFAFRVAGQLLVGFTAYGVAQVIRKKMDMAMYSKEDLDDADIEQKESIEPERTPIKFYVDGFFADMKRLLSLKLPWSERTTLEKAYTALFVAMLIALFPLPYGFYDSLRVLICIGLYFFFQAVLPERDNKRGWFLLIIGLFVLYNPVIPIRIGEQAIWTLLNAGTIYALFRARLTLENHVKAERPEL